MDPIFLCNDFDYVDNTIIKRYSKGNHDCSCQNCKKPTITEPCGTSYTDLPEFASEPHRNPPEPSKTFRNLPSEYTPAPIGTRRNFPEPASRTYTSTHRNSPELASGTGTFRNLLPQSVPATRTGTHRSLSGLKTPLAYAVRKISNIKSNRYKINFGDIPINNSLYICHASLHGHHSFCAAVSPMWTMLSSKDIQNNYIIAPVKIARQINYIRIFWNLPNPASGT